MATTRNYEIIVTMITHVTEDGFVCETGHGRFTGKTPVEWVTGLAKWLVTCGMVNAHLVANAQTVLDDLENYRENASEVGAQLEAPHMMMSLVAQLTEADPAWRVHTRALG